jgi:hypothetical protein
VVQKETRLGLAFYWAEGEVERTTEAVAWELDRPTINSGGGWLGARRFRWRGRGGAAVVGGVNAAAPFMVEWWRRRGAGRPDAAGRPVAGAGKKGGGRRWRLKKVPTGGPHLSVTV